MRAALPRLIAIAVGAAGLPLAISACAPSLALPSEEPATGPVRLGIAASKATPRTALLSPPIGPEQGAVAGAAAGVTLVGLRTVFAALVVCAATPYACAATIGPLQVAEVAAYTVAGASLASTRDELQQAKDAEAQIRAGLEHLKPNEALRDAVIRYANRKASQALAPVPWPDGAAADPVLEVGVAQIRLAVESRALLALRIRGHARLLAPGSDRVLSQRTFEFVSETRGFDAWAANDAAAFRAALDRAWQDLAERIVRELVSAR